MMNVNSAADITRMIGTLAADKAFVLNDSGTGLSTAGVGHRLAKHFGWTSALQKNTQTLDAIKTALRENPAYAGINDYDFNLCFRSMSRGHAVTGARLQAAIQSLDALCVQRQHADAETALTAASQRFRQLGEQATSQAALILAADDPAHPETRQKLADLVRLAGDCPQKENAKDRDWVVSALSSIVKFKLQGDFLTRFKTDRNAAPEAVTTDQIREMLDAAIAEMTNDAVTHGWEGALLAFTQRYEMPMSTLSLDMEDALETHRARLPNAQQMPEAAPANPNGKTLSLVRYAPPDITEQAQNRMKSLSKEDIARAYHFERQFGLGTDEAIRQDIASGASRSVFLRMAANPQYLTDKTAYLKGKADLLKHNAAMERMSSRERDQRANAKSALLDSENLRLSGKLERGEFGGEAELNGVVSETIRTHFRNVQPNSRVGQTLARQLTSLHRQHAQQDLQNAIEMRYDYRIGKFPGKLDPFEFDVSQHLATLDGNALDEIASRLTGLSDAEAETFLSLTLTRNVLSGLEQMEGDATRIGARLDAIAAQAKALVAFSQDPNQRLLGTPEEERAMWTGFCQCENAWTFGGAKGLLIKELTPQEALQKVATIARNMKHILSEIAAGGKAPTLEQLHALYQAGAGLDENPNVKGDALNINAFACGLALQSLSRDGQSIPKLQKALTEPNMRKILTNAFKTLGTQIPESVQQRIMGFDLSGLTIAQIRDYGQKATFMNEAVSMMPMLFSGLNHFNDTPLTVLSRAQNSVEQQLGFTYGDTFIPPLGGEKLDPENLNGRQRSAFEQMSKELSIFEKEVTFIVDWVDSVASVQGPLTDQELIGLMTRKHQVPEGTKFLAGPASGFNTGTWTCVLAALDDGAKAALAQRLTPEVISSAADRIFAELDEAVPPERQQKVIRREAMDDVDGVTKAKYSDAFKYATGALQALNDLSKAVRGGTATVQASNGRTLNDILPR